MPAGVGSYVHYDRKLDAKIARAVMSINAFKGVEFGLGFEMARNPEAKCMMKSSGMKRTGIREEQSPGWIRRCMSTGMPISVKGVMKPIPTLYKPLKVLISKRKKPFRASIERSDSCAVPAASVVAEAVVAWELASAIVEQFHSDRFDQLLDNVGKTATRIKEF